MPMARWLAGRYGRKTVYQVLHRRLRGRPDARHAGDDVPAVRVARIVQGAASGTLAPLSLAILLDVLPPPRHARISLVWSVCLVLGISSGASIGGWLSEYHGWHSIFYFSLPMAGFIFLTVALSLPEKRAEQNPPFDFFGLATFSLGMIGLQMLLDRGERLEWFASAEIWVEASASVLGFYLFIVHVMTTRGAFSQQGAVQGPQFRSFGDHVLRRRLRPAADPGFDLADAGGIAQLSRRYHRLHDHSARRRAGGGAWC